MAPPSAAEISPRVREAYYWLAQCPPFPAEPQQERRYTEQRLTLKAWLQLPWSTRDGKCRTSGAIFQTEELAMSVTPLSRSAVVSTDGRAPDSSHLPAQRWSCSRNQIPAADVLTPPARN